MTTKKKARRKKMAKAGRPKGKSPSYLELGLRATKAQYDIIQEATEKDAERRNVPISRNNFCLRAAIAAAKKELGIVNDVPEDDGL